MPVGRSHDTRVWSSDTKCYRGLIVVEIRTREQGFVHYRLGYSNWQQRKVIGGLEEADYR